MTNPDAWGGGRCARPAFRWAPVAVAAVLLAGCGGGDDDGTTPPPSVGAFTIGGTVAGLGSGKTLTLQNNAGDDLSVNANGSFVFVTRLDSGVAYAVTVKTQPAGQRCAVAQGSGKATANVTDVQVRCENLPAATFSVGGSVAGLVGGTVVLQNNGGDDLAVASNGGFTFATPLAGGAAYAVSVRTQPAGQACTVRNGAGTVSAANVGSVEVNCGTVVALPEGDWKQEFCSQVRPGQWGARSGASRAERYPCDRTDWRSHLRRRELLGRGDGGRALERCGHGGVRSQRQHTHTDGLLGPVDAALGPDIASSVGTHGLASVHPG